MTLGRYFQKIFFTRIVITMLIAIFIATTIETLQLSTTCKIECNSLRLTMEGLFNGILFADNALFFIITISTIWFLVYVISTSQMQIALIYSKSPWFIIKNATLCLFKFCILYSIVFDFILIKHLYGDESFITKYTATPYVWMSSQNNDLLNKKQILYLQNVILNDNIITASSLDIYDIEDNRLSKYIQYTNIKIPKTSNENSTVISNGKLITINGISFNKIVQNIFNEKTLPRMLLLKSIQSFIYKTPLVVNPILIILHIVEKYLSLIVPTIVGIIFLSNVKTARSGTFGINILKTIIFSTLFFTLFEIVKIIDIYSIMTQKIALILIISFIMTLIYVFIVKHV